MNIIDEVQIIDCTSAEVAIDMGEGRTTFTAGGKIETLEVIIEIDAENGEVRIAGPCTFAVTDDNGVMVVSVWPLLKPLAVHDLFAQADGEPFIPNAMVIMSVMGLTELQLDGDRIAAH